MAVLNYQNLLDKLNEFISKYYKNQLLKGGIYSAGILMLFFISLATAEYVGHFNTVIRTILFYSFIVTGVAVLVKYILTPLLKIYKLGDTLTYEEAAIIVGKHFPDVKDKLLNVLQLQQQKNLHTYTAELSLLEASIQQKIITLAPVPFASAIDFSENKKYLKFIFIPIILIAIASFTAPGLLKDSTQRIVQHNEQFERKAPFTFTILNKNLSAIAQQDFTLNVKLSGTEIPNEVYIIIDGNEFLINKTNAVNLSYVFKNIQKDTRFQLMAEDFKSKEYELKALPNPILLNFELKLVYPAYLNRKPETIKNTGDITVPKGTKVNWEFFTKNTDLLRLMVNDSAIALKMIAENKFGYNSILYKDQPYALATSNQFVKNNDSVNYFIRVIPDEFPQITVDEKRDSVSFKQIYFTGKVQDDYGFKKLTFNYRFVSNKDSAVTAEFKAITTNSLPIAINTKATQDRFFHFWDLNEINVAPGDVLEYYFEVWDNDGINGSKSSKTPIKLLKTPTREALEEKTDKANESIKDDLAKTIKDAKDAQKEVSDLQRKLAEKKSASWEEKKKLEDLLAKQAALHKKVEKLNERNTQNLQQQSEYKQQDEEIVNKQKQLEELFNSVMTPELKEKYEQMQKLLEQLDKEKIQQALEKIQLDNKDLMKELDRNLEIFKQLEVEQKLQENIDKLAELAKKQEELAQKSADNKADAKQLAEEQKKLNEEFEKIQKDLADLQEKNKALEQPKDIAKTEEEQKAIQDEMQKSSDELENNKKKPASESQKKSAEKMDALSKKMAQMQSSMQAQEQAENIDDLRNILENLIQLSFGQEALMKQLSTTSTSDPEFYKINQKQVKLRDDTKMIEDSLFALSKRVPEIEPVINKEISGINDNMAKAIAELSEAPTINFDRVNHHQEAQSRQQFAMTSINNLALMLNEALVQMQQEAKNQKPGNGSCNKPGGKGSGKGGDKPSAASMRKMQEALNKRIKELKDGQGKGEGKGGAGMSQQLAQMAAEQEAIRREVQKMANELNKEGKGGAGMNKLLNEMEKTETDLINKVINQETINRQEEILSRLLESEKAEKEREQDEKRQSTESENEKFGNPNEFLEYKEQKRQETELLKTVPPKLNPFFKEKIKLYFMNFED